MKKIIFFISIVFTNFIFAQCENYNQFQCNDNNNCEWVEDIETGNCGNLYGDDCELNPECNWNCDFVDDYMGWCNYSCDGGPYEIDNSYCQETEMPECSEMNELECSSDDVCEWIEDIEIENCYDILDCTGGCTWQDCEGIEGCNWHFGTAYYDPSYCYGEHEADNSYCEEIEYLSGDINQDSIINIQDIIIIINLILNAEFDLVADINLDSTVNVLDVIQLVNIILNN